MADTKYSQRDLHQWLMTKAQESSGAHARRVIKANDERQQSSTIIGKLYFFAYDPKWKDKLSKYDKFPMVFPIEMYGDGFLGLNLHYLTVPQRQVLLGRLMEFASNTKINKNTKLRLSYDLIQGTRKLNSLAQPCIKRYLYSHCRSKFIQIYADEFDKAIQLPVADWVFNVR
jgi:hypothetical protein